MAQSEDDASAVLKAFGVQLKRGKSGKVRVAQLPPESQASLTEEAWQALVSLASLARLEAPHSDICDQHVTQLQTLKGLKQLDLSHTAVSDGAADALESMSQLELLKLTGSKISKERLATMRKSMLNTRIVCL